MSSFQQKACSKCGLHPAAGTQLRRCGSCLAVKYCSSACQTEDWASHRLVCRNVGAAGKEELMPLICAAKNGDVATVKRLLKAGAKVDGDNIYNDHEASMLITPLFMAAANGEAAVIAVLLEAGAAHSCHKQGAHVRSGGAETVDSGHPLLTMFAHEGYAAVLAALRRKIAGGRRELYAHTIITGQC